MLHRRPSRPQPAPRALCSRQTACTARQAPVRLTQCALLATICHCTPSRRAGRRAGTGTSTCAERARGAGLCTGSAVSYMRARPMRGRVQRLQIGYPLWHIEPCRLLVHFWTVMDWWRMFTSCTPLTMHSVLSPRIQTAAGCQPLAVLAYTERNALAGPSDLPHIHTASAPLRTEYVWTAGTLAGGGVAPRRRGGEGSAAPPLAAQHAVRAHQAGAAAVRAGGRARAQRALQAAGGFRMPQLKCPHGAGVHHSPLHSGGGLCGGRSRSAGAHGRAACTGACAPHGGRACVWGAGRMPRVSHGLTMLALASHADSWMARATARAHHRSPRCRTDQPREPRRAAGRSPTAMVCASNPRGAVAIAMKNWLQLQLCARAHGERRAAARAPCSAAALHVQGRPAHPADEVCCVGAAPAQRAQRASGDGRDTLVRRAKPARSPDRRRGAGQAGQKRAPPRGSQTLGRLSSGARPDRGMRREGLSRALCAGRRRLVHVRLQLAVRPGVVVVAGGLHVLDERRARVAEHGVAHHGAPACGTRGSPSGPTRAPVTGQRRAVRPASKDPTMAHLGRAQLEGLPAAPRS
jgi:hypothetical protein